MILLFLGAAHAAVFTVDPAGGGDFTTIGDAMAAAMDGDTVLVQPGYYRENVSFGGKAIVLRSQAGAEQTILDGGDVWDTSTVSFTSGEPVGATLQGFTITNGHGQPLVWNLGRSWTGAGILVSGANAAVQDCVITGNAARHSGQSVGGGMAVVDGYAVVSGTTFIDNEGYYAGGGMAILGGYVELEDNIFADNLSGRGAGLAVLDGASVLSRGNLFRSNEAQYGAGVYVHQASFTSLGDRFLENEAMLDGASLYTLDGDATVARARFEGAVAARDGGHLYVGPGSEVTVTAGEVMQGAALVGGAMVSRDATLTLDGVLLAANYATETGAELWAADSVVVLDQLTSLDGESAGALFRMYGGSAELVDLIVSSGSAATICEADDGVATLAWSLIHLTNATAVLGACTEGDGMLVGDPRFVDAVSWPPDVSLGEGSPAIDAGDPARLDRDQSRADLGATGGDRPWSP